jgi:REP element-mobilizing transposase RayT
MQHFRRLPHIFDEGCNLFITWRLYGSLPRERYPPPGKMNSGAAFVWMDRYLDTTLEGPQWLRGEIAQVVEEVLHRQECDLHAYVIMPNHVHVLLAPKIPPAKLTQYIKGASAREANKVLGISGKPFWQHESYDHRVRTAEEFTKIQKYIENNPVKAGLAATPETYRWSSAWSGWRGFSLQRPLQRAAGSTCRLVRSRCGQSITTSS